MTPPRNQKQVRQFIRLLNYYRDICDRRLHLLQPLTEPTPYKVTFKWAGVEQKSFYEIKRIVSCNTLLAYPYFDKLLHIHTDAINHQLVAFIIQEGKPIYFYSCKLIVPQTLNTVMEK